MHLLCWKVAGASTANSQPQVPGALVLSQCRAMAAALPSPGGLELGPCWPCPGAASTGTAAGSPAERAGMSAAQQDMARPAGKGLWRFLDLLFLVLRFVVFFFFYKTSPQEGV